MDRRTLADDEGDMHAAARLQRLRADDLVAVTRHDDGDFPGGLAQAEQQAAGRGLV